MQTAINSALRAEHELPLHTDTSNIFYLVQHSVNTQSDRCKNFQRVPRSNAENVDKVGLYEELCHLLTGRRDLGNV